MTEPRPVPGPRPRPSEPRIPAQLGDLDHVLDGPDWDAPPVRHAAIDPETGKPTVRRVRVSRKKRRRRRRLGLWMVMLGGLILLGFAWLAFSGLIARSELVKARADVHLLRTQISAGDLSAARATAADLAKHAHRAHEFTTGPVWAPFAALPSGGEPLRTIRGITAQLDQVGADALPQLVSASEVLDPSTIRRPDGSVDIAKLAAVAPALDHAAAAMTAASARIAALPPHTWLATIDTARGDVLAQLGSLGNTVKSADIAARTLPTMLGASGRKSYFVAFQNDAEARGTGGLPGAFAILDADHGKLTFSRFESDAALFGYSADVDFGPQYNQLWAGAGTTTLYGNGNLSPNFPYAAQIWASMWQKKSGQRVDGVMAFDPTALSYLLAVSGPATLPDHTMVGTSNVVSLTQSTVYSLFAPADNLGRRNYLLDIARQVSRKILATTGSTTSLAKAAGQAAGERRFLVWSADPSIEAQLAPTSVSGVIPATTAPYVGLSIVNDGGNKLDYYLDRSLTWQRSGCGSARMTTVTITLTNNAPATGLSTYVTGRSDSHSYPVQPGDNRLEVSYLATQGAAMSGVDVNGRPGGAAIGVQSGHPTYTVDLELPRGASRTIVLHLTEPAGTGSPIVLRQPLVRPLTVAVQDTSCR